METRCADCVDRYIQRYGWGLISRDALLTLVENEYLSRSEVGEAAARAAVLWCYSAVMHRACSGEAGDAQREQGYLELYAFLAYAARRRYTHIGADATQRAIERIYVCFASCRRPETFLAFALQKLRDAARAELSTALRAAEALPECDIDQATARPLASQDGRADPADVAIHRDLSQQIARCARHFVEQHPRAAQQFRALWMRHIEGLDDGAIGARLGTSAAAVQVMRSRAARRLRCEPDWQLLAVELGLLPATPAGG